MVAHGGCVVPFGMEDHNYEPDWEAWHASGRMCTGFGDGPVCARCGRREYDHPLDRVYEGKHRAYDPLDLSDLFV